MTKEEIINNLCYYDIRNPYFIDLGLDNEDYLKSEPCSCDNCFYGRTKMAEFILERIYNDKYGNLITVFNINKFCKENGIHFSNLLKVLKGQRNHTGGYRACN